MIRARNAECGARKRAASADRSPCVFVVGLLLLIVLWLPPLPWPLRAADLPPSLAQFLSWFKTIKPTEAWPLRLDYILVPPLFFYALWTAWKSRISLSESGLGWRHFGGALRVLWRPTLIGALILLGVGWACDSIHLSDRFWKRLNPLNGLVQQIAIQLFFHRQLMPWFGAGRKTAWILTLFFMALHAPNPGLMLGTLFGMYFWARCYQKEPNLYALSLSHAFLSALLMHTLPQCLLPSVSVGQRFVEKGIANHWWGWL